MRAMCVYVKLIDKVLICSAACSNTFTFSRLFRSRFALALNCSRLERDTCVLLYTQQKATM